MKKSTIQKIINEEIKKILKENWHVNREGGFPGPPIDSDPYGDLPEPEAEFGEGMEICPECGGAGCPECHGEGVIEFGGFGGREI